MVDPPPHDMIALHIKFEYWDLQNIMLDLGAGQ